MRSPSHRLTSAPSTLSSAHNQQQDYTGSDRQNSDRDTKASVIPKAHFKMFTCRFSHDHIRNRTDDGEIAGKGSGKREYLPHQLGMVETRDPFSRHQHKRNIRKTFEPAAENQLAQAALFNYHKIFASLFRHPTFPRMIDTLPDAHGHFGVYG